MIMRKERKRGEKEGSEKEVENHCFGGNPEIP